MSACDNGTDLFQCLDARPGRCHAMCLQHVARRCRYLSVQSVVWPQTGAAAATAAVGPLVNWLLVFKLGFGLDGAAAATVLLYTVETLLLLGIVIVRDRRLAGTDQRTWHGWCVVSRAA